MKPFISAMLIFMSLSSAVIADSLEDFNVILAPQWHDLEYSQEKAKQFGGKWILAGSITFKKKAKDTVHLSRIYLQWEGLPIENLVASLYKTDSDKPFLPIQENLVCDGVWNKAQQTLMLNFEKKETLGFTNIFNVVLTVPDELEPTLKNGSFNVLPTSLPEPFKEYAHEHSLSLTFNKPLKPLAMPLKIASR
jgi:hypothetical protein